MSKFQVPLRELGRGLSIFSLDVSGSTGLCSMHLSRTPAGVRVQTVARLDGVGYVFQGPPATTATKPGSEMVLARHAVHESTSIHMQAGGPDGVLAVPMVLVMEGGYMGLNPSTADKLAMKRGRWDLAFETAARSAGRPLELVIVPPAVWQCDWLGIPSNAGRPAMKFASDEAAAHVVETMRLSGPIVEDEADALNLGLWWLDKHLRGLPRKWKAL